MEHVAVTATAVNTSAADAGLWGDITRTVTGLKGVIGIWVMQIHFRSPY
jgi:hypothetical protein